MDIFEKMLLAADPGRATELFREYLVFQCGLRGNSLEEFKRRYGGVNFVDLLKCFDRNHPDCKEHWRRLAACGNSCHDDLHRDMIALATAMAPQIYARLLGGKPEDYDAETARMKKELEKCRQIAGKYGYMVVKRRKFALKKRNTTPERYFWEEFSGSVYPV